MPESDGSSLSRMSAFTPLLGFLNGRFWWKGDSDVVVSGMDFSGIMMVPVATLITTAWTIGAAILERPPRLRIPLWLSYFCGVVVMEPWRVATWVHLGMLAVMLIMLALWVAAGWMIGRFFGAAVLALGRRLTR